MLSRSFASASSGSSQLQFIQTVYLWDVNTCKLANLTDRQMRQFGTVNAQLMQKGGEFR